jgi:Ca2+/Na+ antiporter
MDDFVRRGRNLRRGITMTHVNDAPKPGYFNALAAGAFKITPDGRRLFFPWGVLGRGYEIPTDQEYQQLRRQMRLYIIVSLTLVIVPMAAQYTLVGLSICVLLMVSFAIWSHYRLRGMKPVDERLTFGESVSIQARTHRPVTLWVLLIASLVLVASGIAVLLLQPGEWVAAVLAIIFFTLCAAMFAWMLRIRRRAISQS